MAKKDNSPAVVPTGTVYVLHEKVRETLSEDMQYMLEDDEIDEAMVNLAEGWSPLEAFRDQAAATAKRDALETKRRTKENPFENGKQLSDWTSFGAPQFHDWLLDAGLEPPKKKKPSGAEWREWWEAHAKKMTALQRAKVWEALDKVRYYDVVAIKV